MPITSVRASSPGGDTAAASSDGTAAHHFLRTGPTEMMRPAAAAAAGQGSAEDTIVIRVRDLTYVGSRLQSAPPSGDEETYFKLRMVTPMKRVFDTYALRKGMCVSTLRFLLVGSRIGADETPSSLQLEHHDQIDCYREQPTPDWFVPHTATPAAARRYPWAEEWSGVTRQRPRAESEDETTQVGGAGQQEPTAQAEVDLPRDTPDRAAETFTSIQASLEAAEDYGGVAQDKYGTQDGLLPPKATCAADAADVFFCRTASGGEVGRLKAVEAEKMSEGITPQVR
ncbi:unnamed protein product [Ectocarpus fasciculatus]